jgi:tetratricopeptide (TPR) repeat protein
VKNDILNTKSGILVLVLIFLASSILAVNKGLKPVVTGSVKPTYRYQARIAICVGIDKYSAYAYKKGGKPNSNLKQAVNDATKMASLFKRLGFDEVILITDKNATQDNIIKTLERVKASLQEKDLLVFYFSGHGAITRVNMNSYLVPFDCAAGEKNIINKGISIELLKEMSMMMNNHHTLFLLDCCFSGLLIPNKPRKPDTMEHKQFTRFLSKRCVYALAASGITEAAIEKSWVGGVFTHSVLRALSGHADIDNDGKVSVIADLMPFVRNEVSFSTKASQRPKGARLVAGDGEIYLPIASEKNKPKRPIKTKPAKEKSDLTAIEKRFAKVLSLEKEKKIKQSGALMSSVYLDSITLAKGVCPKDTMAKYLWKMSNLAEIFLKQSTRGDSAQSALATYYYRKYIELCPDDKLVKAQVYMNMGSYYGFRGYYNEAKTLILKALELLTIEQERGNDKSTKPIMVCLMYLGKISCHLYQYAEAREYLNRANALVDSYRADEKTSKYAEDIAKLFNTNGVYYNSIGSYSKAKQWLNKALDEYRRCVAEKSLGAAAVYNNLGENAALRKNYYEALRYFKRSLEINTDLFGGSSLQTANSRNSLAVIYLLRGDLDKAMKSARKSKSIFSRYLVSGHPSNAVINSTLGKIYIAKERYSPAESFLKRSLAITRRRYGNHPRTARACKELGHLYLIKHRWLKAEKLLKEAKTINDEYLGSTHYLTASTRELLKKGRKMKSDQEKIDLQRKDGEDGKKTEVEKKKKGLFSW